MTNAEKYKQEIGKLVKANEQAKCVLSYNIKSKELTRCGMTRCGGLSCNDCLFWLTPKPKSTCTDACEDWLQSEYKEDSEYEEDTERNTINDEPKEKEDIGKARKVKQLLFVEDGSVDMFNLYSQLSGNPEIAIIVYRENSRIPVLVNLEEAKE